MLEVSNARIKVWRKCRNAHYYKYVENIEARKKKAPLMKGSIIHDMINAWVRGESWGKVLKQYQKDYDKLFQEEKDEYGDIINDLKTIMEGYIKKWENLDIEYLETEKEIEVELIPGRIMLVAVIDRIEKDSKNRIWLGETKSFKQSLPKEEIRFTDLQTTLYVWAAPQAGLPSPFGVSWDYIRTKPPTIPDLLKKGGLSKAKKIDTTYEVYLQTLKEHELDPSNYADILEDLRTRPDTSYRRVYRPAPNNLIGPLLRDFKESALEIEALGDTSRVRHLTRDCGWCDYYSICQAELRGLDTDYIRKIEYQERRKKDESKKAEEEA